MGLRKRKGDVLITIIIAMLIMGVLGAGIYSITASSTFGELLTNRNDNAYDLARAGVRYGVAIQLANYPETTFYMPDANSAFTIKIENYVITSTGIANAGSFLEARRVIVYDLAVTWGSGTGTSEPPPPTSPVIESDTEFPSFSEPIASGESGGSAVQADPDTNTITMGGGVEDSYGSLWYQGSSIVGYCTDGICNFGLGIRAYFEFTFLNEDRSSDSTTYADGFTFAVLSATDPDRNNTRDRTGGAVGEGELIGYAGAGDTADGLGLKPPKIALEFDTFPNPGTGNICQSDSRNDPRTQSGPWWNPTYTFYNHVALMFWGARTASGTGCTGSPNSYDDNKHGAGGSGGNPQNSAGTGDSGYYQPASQMEPCMTSGSCNWMESRRPYVCRIEIVRPGSLSGPYPYEIKAWISRKDSFADPLAMSRFQDVIVPYTDTTAQINKTVSLSEADHNDFSKIFFGFTEATGSSTQQIELTNFRVFFPQGDCTYSITPEAASATAAGGSGSVNLTTTTTSCPWMTSSLSDWITVTSGSVGAGNGTIGYAVAANTGPARTGYINIVGQTFTVNQADGCVYTLSSYSQSFGRYAGTGTVTVTSVTGCTWTAASNNSWISITSGSSGSGTGTVGYSVSTNNTGAPRTGTMIIAGQTFTVTQAAQPTCTLAVSPNIVPYGGTTSLTWTIANGPANGSWSPSPGGVCANFSNSSGGTCTSGSQTTAGDRTYTLTVSNANGSSTCSATVYTGCSEYRVWNNTGSRRDFRVTGSGCRRVNNGSEITTDTYRLSSGETVTRYNTNNGSCGAAQGTINYTGAMNADIEISGGNGNCRVNYNSGDTVGDR